MATLPQQAPGPGPTAQALPSYLSYSAVATNVLPYTSTLTQVVYDPEGGFAPYQTINTIQGTTTSIDYSIINVPLLYTGPFPAPDLGTLYTTPGQSLPSPTRATPTTATSTPTVTPTSAPTESTTSAPSSQNTSVTAQSPPSTAAVPTSSTATPTTSSTGTVPAPISSTATATTLPSTTISETTSSRARPTTTPQTRTSSTVGPSSSSSGASSGTTSEQPSATVAGGPNPRIQAASGLSGGQIAGIVLGAFFALLLLLLLLLCCLRRRRRKHQEAAVLAAATGGRASVGGSFAGGGARGNYTALGVGAGAGAAGLGAANAGRRGSIGSDDWEEDHLTGSGGGTGFFVVGGRRLGPQRRASIASRRSRGSSGTGHRFSAANVAPASAGSDSKASGFGALVAAGAGLVGAAFGRSRNKSRTQVEHEEEQPLSDEDLGDGSMMERRGLMPFHDSPNRGYGSGPEMRETSAQILSPAAAAQRGSSAQGENRARHVGQGRDTGSPQRLHNMGGLGATGPSPPMSSAFSGSGASSSGFGTGSHATGGSLSSQTGRGSGAGVVSSSNSTGGFTASGSGASLPPPPRAPRNSPQSPASTYGNVAASTATPSPPTALASSGQDPRLSADTIDSATSAAGGLNPALLGTGVLGGLGALAAGHRESDGSAYSQPRPAFSSNVRGSHASELSAEELSHLRSSDPERYSRFISTGSNLLGPDYQPSPEIDAENKELGDKLVGPSFMAGTMGTGATAFQRTRLPTIRSVGEFGEKSDSSAPASQNTGNRTTSSQPHSSLSAVTATSGSLGAASTGSRRVISPLPVYEQHQLQAGESLPDYDFHDQHAAPRRLSDTEQRQSPISDSHGFVTPPDSPRNLLGGAVGTRSGEPASSEERRYGDVGGSNFGNSADQDESDNRRGAELAEAGVASAGILGGVAAGWRRLTMGQYAWVPGTASSRDHQASSFRDSSGDLDDPQHRNSHEQGQRVSEDSSRLVHQRRASRVDTSDAGFAPDVRSERASVYGPSTLGNNTSRSSPIAHLSSKEASGSSGEQAKSQGSEMMGGAAQAGGPSTRQRSYPSLSSQHSSSGRSRGGGYTASHSNSSVSGRRAASDNTGLDSLSAVAQLSSRSSGSASSRSRNRSSSRGGRSGGISEVSFGSGASTGAASYSPSGNLSRGNTTSTRGLADSSAPTASATYYASRRSGEASSLMTDAADAGGSEMDYNSSRATQGGSSSQEKRKRPRSSSVDALSRLDSLREVREFSDPFGDVSGIPEVPLSDPPAGGHYPSESLGAAVSRSVARDSRQQQSSFGGGGSENFLASQLLPQRSHTRSLQPGIAIPAPTVLAPSLSTPSLHSSGRAEPTGAISHPALASSSSGGSSGFPASASWRPSPRVASAAQRAAEAQASLLQNQQGESRGLGAATPPRSQAASPSATRPGASYSWADLDTTLREPDRTQPSADLEDTEEGTSARHDPDTSNKSFDWPKFLRF